MNIINYLLIQKINKDYNNKLLVKKENKNYNKKISECHLLDNPMFYIIYL